jgi:hypothetical protein
LNQDPGTLRKNWIIFKTTIYLKEQNKYKHKEWNLKNYTTTTIYYSFLEIEKYWNLVSKQFIENLYFGNIQLDKVEESEIESFFTAHDFQSKIQSQ